MFSLFASGFATPACAAPATYSYTGQPFTLFGGSGESCTMGVGDSKITGAATFAAPLAPNLTANPIVNATPLSYSFTGGTVTITLTLTLTQLNSLPFFLRDAAY